MALSFYQGNVHGNPDELSKPPLRFNKLTRFKNESQLMCCSSSFRF